MALSRLYRLEIFDYFCTSNNIAHLTDLYQVYYMRTQWSAVQATRQNSIITDMCHTLEITQGSHG